MIFRINRRGDEEGTKRLQTVPLLPLRDIVVFPHTMVPFVVGRRSSLLAVERALAADKRLFLSTQRNAKVDDPSEDEVNTVGTTATRRPRITHAHTKERRRGRTGNRTGCSQVCTAIHVRGDSVWVAVHR